MSYMVQAGDRVCLTGVSGGELLLTVCREASA